MKYKVLEIKTDYETDAYGPPVLHFVRRNLRFAELE